MLGFIFFAAKIVTHFFIFWEGGLFNSARKFSTPTTLKIKITHSAESGHICCTSKARLCPSAEAESCRTCRSLSMGKELLEPRKHWDSFLVFQYTMLENTINSDHFGSFFLSFWSKQKKVNSFLKLYSL